MQLQATLGRVLRRFSRVLRRERLIEGAWKAETRPFAEYDPLHVHPMQEKDANPEILVNPLFFGKCEETRFRIFWGVVVRSWRVAKHVSRRFLGNSPKDQTSVSLLKIRPEALFGGDQKFLGGRVLWYVLLPEPTIRAIFLQNRFFVDSYFRAAEFSRESWRQNHSGWPRSLRFMHGTVQAVPGFWFRRRLGFSLQRLQRGTVPVPFSAL